MVIEVSCCHELASFLLAKDKIGPKRVGWPPRKTTILTQGLSSPGRIFSRCRKPFGVHEGDRNRHPAEGYWWLPSLLWHCLPNGQTIQCRKNLADTVQNIAGTRQLFPRCFQQYLPGRYQRSHVMPRVTSPLLIRWVSAFWGNSYGWNQDIHYGYKYPGLLLQPLCNENRGWIVWLIPIKLNLSFCFQTKQSRIPDISKI